MLTDSKNTHMSMAFFESAYDTKAGWEIGRAQKAFIDHFRDNEPEQPILDVGCGTGDLAIHLARPGREVIGVDYIETAVNLAREKALKESVGVDFAVMDAFALADMDRKFGSVVDSGFFHTLDDDCRQEFMRILTAILKPNGRYYMLSNDLEPIDDHTPRTLTEGQVRALFSGGWLVREIRHTVMESSYYNETVPGLFCVVQKLPT